MSIINLFFLTAKLGCQLAVKLSDVVTLICASGSDEELESSSLLLIVLMGLG